MRMERSSSRSTRANHRSRRRSFVPWSPNPTQRARDVLSCYDMTGVIDHGNRTCRRERPGLRIMTTAPIVERRLGCRRSQPHPSS
jgi:hypothetical protein